PELYFELAAELVQANVDVIVVTVGAAVPAVQRANPRIPIVLGGVTDPVGFGLIASLARPGGNVTGLARSDEASTPKQLELLTMIAPYVPRIGYAMSAIASPPNIIRLKAAQDAATQAGRELVPVEINNLEGVPGAFATLANERAGALLVASTPLILSLRQRIAELALQNRLPTMFAIRDFVGAGGLMSYGDSVADFHRRAAFYVDKILKVYCGPVLRHSAELI